MIALSVFFSVLIVDSGGPKPHGWSCPACPGTVPGPLPSPGLADPTDPDPRLPWGTDPGPAQEAL